MRVWIFILLLAACTHSAPDLSTSRPDPAPAESPAAALALVSQVCSGTPASETRVREDIQTQLLPVPARADALLLELKAGRAAGCAAALAWNLKRAQEDPRGDAVRRGNLGLLQLALRAGLPGAAQFAVREIEKGHQPEDWLLTLGECEPQSVQAVISRWVEETSAELRKAAEPRQLLAPLLVSRYLTFRERDSKAPDAAEWRILLPFFAAVEPASRRGIQDALVRLARRDAVAWVHAVRAEPLGLQRRLHPMYLLVGGPEVARELMWMASHQQDPALRSMADQSLDQLGAR